MRTREVWRRAGRVEVSSRGRVRPAGSSRQLTADAVLFAYRSNQPEELVAAILGVSADTVRRIRIGETWADVTRIAEPRPHGTTR